MRDKLGQEITPGCYIAYGHLLGRCAGLRLGRVLAVREITNAWGRTEARITVQGVNDSQYLGEPGKYGPGLCKKGTLRYAERTIVLSEAMVPDQIKALL